MKKRRYRSVLRGEKVKRICKQCEKEFETYPSEIKKGNGKFCSRECWETWINGENNPNWKGGGVEFVCENCGKKFKLGKWQLKKQKGMFCSRKCANIFNVKREGESPWWTGGKKEVICQECGKTFLAKPSAIKRGNRFCSRVCYFKYSRRHTTRPTKPELIFQEICQRNNLDFHYVGDGQLWIGKRKKMNPDFVKANGEKICVEIMGAYWHSPLLNPKLREDALLPYRKRHYHRYKWIPIFIWDTDLLRGDAEQFVLKALSEVLE